MPPQVRMCVMDSAARGASCIPAPTWTRPPGQQDNDENIMRPLQATLRRHKNYKIY